MGKASSNKKVARAAGTGGGRTHRARTPWTYFGAVALVVLLGVLGTWASRDRRLAQINNRGSVQPTVGTVWNEGYAVYECGKFVPAIAHARDPYGITTGNGDGIIHIHPTVKSAAGKNATLGKFASAVGMTLNAGALKVPGGKLHLDGDSCEGHPGHVYVKQFNDTGDSIGALQNVDPRNVLLQDQSMVTIAFVPSGDKNAIPAPPTYVINNLNKLAASSTSSTTTPTPVTPTTQPTSTTQHTTTTKAQTSPSTTVKK
jgi:hypothetical protein